MPKLAIIGGSNLFGLKLLKQAKLKRILTPYGKAFYYLINNSIFINRHGKKRKYPSS